MQHLRTFRDQHARFGYRLAMSDQKKREKAFYISWIAVNNDPWALSDIVNPDGPQPTFRERGTAPGDQKPVVFRSRDDSEWPCVPEVIRGESRHLLTGPTLSALFHPNSPLHNLQGLDHVYLLYQPGVPKSPHEHLREVMHRIAQARKLDGFDRVQLVPIKGLEEDPTDHDLILRALAGWLDGCQDPLHRKNGRIKHHRIVVNLSPGTPSMHACWLLLYWKGALGTPVDTSFTFYQGDGGMTTNRFLDESKRKPLRFVPVDVLSQYRTAPPPADSAVTADASSAQPAEAAIGHPFAVRLEQLECDAYVELREKIEQAATLGLPILLHGERGSGKTFLARYYHERRQEHRQRQATLELSVVSPQTQRKNRSGGERGSDAIRDPVKSDPRRVFVTVTLSEYASVEELRDQLFGWAKGSWNLADKDYDGLLGDAHKGTLFLDEIHHLKQPLQAALLGPLNERTYTHKGSSQQIRSDFDLVVATNAPDWRKELTDDFRDRIERVVIDVPSFEKVRKQPHGREDLWLFWETTFQRRCKECGVRYVELNQDSDCYELLNERLTEQKLPGNWRALYRLADCVLLWLTPKQSPAGQPGSLEWDRKRLAKAIREAFAES
jgi:transcriptional regulator with AAA-type ATPase domain